MNRAEVERKLLAGARIARDALAGRGYRVVEEVSRSGRVVFRCEGRLGREALASVSLDAAGWTVALSEFAGGERVSSRTESSLGPGDDEAASLVREVVGEAPVAEAAERRLGLDRPPERRTRRVDPRNATVADLARKFWRDDG